MTTIDVAVLQLASVPGDVPANLDAYVAALRQYGPGVDLVVTPELFTTGYDLDLLGRRGHDLAEPLDGSTVRLTAELAAETATTVVLGFLERDGGVLYDTAAIVTPDGGVHAFHKTHLYPTESQRFTAGDRLITVDTPAGRLGPLICFEHAFPELATPLALAGAEILVIPSAVPFGYEHLLTLRTRARAQDNQIFAVACNLTGGAFCGRSLVADPRGEILAEAGVGEQVIRARLDLAAIAAERQREPALRLRRPALYDSSAVVLRHN